MLARIIPSFLSLCVLLGPTLYAGDANKLVGAWERVYWKNLDTGEQSEWPALLILTKKHYAWMSSSPDRRNIVDKTEDQLTHEDLRDLIRFGANSGTYEVSGNKLTLHPRLAKWPCVERSERTDEFRFEGDELITRYKITCECVWCGGNIESRWRRVE